MRIAVLGGDGYCGWATALYLSGKGHSVAVIDNFLRRQWDHELGAATLTPIRLLSDRLRAWQKTTGRTIHRSSAGRLRRAPPRLRWEGGGFR